MLTYRAVGELVAPDHDGAMATPAQCLASVVQTSQSGWSARALPWHGDDPGGVFQSQENEHSCLMKRGGGRNEAGYRVPLLARNSHDPHGDRRPQVSFEQVEQRATSGLGQI